MTVRGQYRGRRVRRRRRCQAIRRSCGNGNEPHTETFVALKAEIDNWRWAGVPFYLRTGKRLASRVSEIVIEFKPIPHSIFDDAEAATERQPAGHPPAARRGREAVADDQGSGPGRHAAAAKCRST